MLRAAAGSDGEKASIDPAPEDPVVSLILEPSGGQPTVALGKKGRHLISVQVEATLMGKGKGTPQLKGDVRSFWVKLSGMTVMMTQNGRDLIELF